MNLQQQCDFISAIVERAILYGFTQEQFMKIAEAAWLVHTAEPTSEGKTEGEPK